MPTKRPRITVTETPALAHRLNLIATRLPERAHSRADLLIALTEVAEEALAEAKRRDSGDGHDDRERAKAFVLQHTAGITPEQAQVMLDQREAEWTQELY